jgi:hypothetical protein
LPFLYSAELHVVAQDKTIDDLPREAVRLFGIRRLGVQGRSLYLDAKRFVLRGVRVDSAEIDDLIAARQSGSALFVTDPSDEFLQEASQEGVLLAVELHASQPGAELSRLIRWPAAAVIIHDGGVTAGKDLRLAARNVLLAQSVASVDPSFAPASWARLLWWQIEAATPVPAPSRHIPVIAYRPTTKNATIELGRRACDRLQADLAPLGDFAGYVC